MLYQITGRQIDIGSALQTHVKSIVGVIAKKHAERPTDAAIVFSRSSSEYVCEVRVHLSTGLTAQAKAHNHKIYLAFNTASVKIEKQLRRYKRKLKDHHQDRSQPVELSSVSSYIDVNCDASNAAEPETSQAFIVAEVEDKIQCLSIDEAVMKMEIAGIPALVFRNEGHNGVNVVY
ncbi:MAG: ribosome-associated translation inhibitor RaiA, partial [Planktomarina sp.]|nr:ribosome-associated translation inhibitor RaiA [Planktomarina sp.]